ncbi:MAG: hypothetical protein U9Q62_09115 [Campylobacterota bacterium]|nr:hypothetical protein [Campylobacterota bacterium]
MLRVFVLVFFFLGSFLHAHESGTGHMHFLSTLHTQDVLAVVVVSLIALIVYKKYMVSR